MSNRQKSTIVVVGGGGAGATVVRRLSKKLDPQRHNLVLITSRNRFAYLPASLRLLVSRDTPIETVFMPYDKVFDKFPGQLKIGTVISVEENKRGGGGGGIAVLDGGEQVVYDVLVVATGSSWEGLVAFPDEESLYKEHVELWRNKFQKAENIVIVGGGAVGIETAGEIKDVYPNKPVTIVQGSKYLLNDIYPQKFRVDLERRLRLRGINIIFDDVIEGQPRVGADAPLKTRKGTPIECDLLVTARGAGPNTSLLRLLPSSPLTDRGYVKVLPTLQVQSHPSIFALGDIVDLPEAKQFAKTAGHATVVVTNILTFLKGEQPKEKCQAGKEIIIVSNGRNGGASYLGILWGLRFGDFLSKTVKSKDLMVGLARKGLGLPATI
ncbi:FAD/NAD(P)-binding domain-containing protein [Crassisporium funariophilum]|nr:FAD/NAD(P)-binding domain-containing protein [Crassisporium funariophilum]